MLNILIPMAGPNIFDKDEFQYPKPLIEIGGKAMIELVIGCLDQIAQPKRYIFVVNNSDCKSYHLDNVLELITKNNCDIIRLDRATRGAACTALMAIEYIDNSNPLIISNSDHIIDYDLNVVMKYFKSRKLDAGTICFKSVHPKWSFVRLDENKKIVETSEKRPLSKNAIAGFYYFQRGSEFVDGAMKMIEKDVHVGGNYFIAPVMNELILLSKNLEIFKIPEESYYNFYSPHKIKNYEA